MWLRRILWPLSLAASFLAALYLRFYSGLIPAGDLPLWPAYLVYLVVSGTVWLALEPRFGVIHKFHEEPLLSRWWGRLVQLDLLTLAIVSGGAFFWRGYSFSRSTIAMFWLLHMLGWMVAGWAVKRRIEVHKAGVGATRVSALESSCLGMILVVALSLRIAGIGWGLPPSTPEVASSGIRSSYAFDEDKILANLAHTRPSRFDFDPRFYHWGTLHFELVLLALEAVQAAGYFDHPWRVSFQQMIPGDFERVYKAGRMVSVATDLLTICFIFLIGVELGRNTAGLFAALLLAVSPAHVLNAAQVRVDATMTAMVALTAWLVLRVQKTPRPRLFLLLGIAAGLSITAKHSSIFVVPLLALIALWPPRLGWRSAGAVLLGAGAGVLAGEPYILTRSREIAQQIGSLWWMNVHTPEEFTIPALTLLRTHAMNLARFSIGIPAAILCLAGLWLLLRRRSPEDRLILTAIGGVVVSLVPLLWPLQRYQLPMLPFLALAAGFALEGFTGAWRWLLGALAVAVPLAASLAQLNFMRSPHTANQAIAAVLKIVPPGASVARLMPELPPLPASYPAGPNPYLDDLAANPPPWVLTADLPDREYPARTQQLLQSSYERIATFRSRRIFPWATLGESRAPHDWKYTHPVMILYRRR